MMTDGTAEKALDTKIANVHDLAYDDVIRVLEADRKARRAVYELGRASRDAEVAELREQLATEGAAIEKVREASERVFYMKTVHRGYTQEDYSRPLLEAMPVKAILSADRPTVLAEHNAEVAAQALEAFDADMNEWYPRDVFPRPTGEDYDRLNKALAHSNLTLDSFSADLMRRAASLARERAASIRSNTEGTN